MTDTVIVAILSLAGSALGTLAGIMTAYKLIEYRVGQLEKKYEKLDELPGRVTRLEGHDEVLETRLKGIEEMISSKLDAMRDRQKELITDVHELMQGG